jgi:hypothetical protein
LIGPPSPPNVLLTSSIAPGCTITIAGASCRGGGDGTSCSKSSRTFQRSVQEHVRILLKVSQTSLASFEYLRLVPDELLVVPNNLRQTVACLHAARRSVGVPLY